MEFGWYDGGEKGEHNDERLVDMSKTFKTQDDFHVGLVSFDRVQYLHSRKHKQTRARTRLPYIKDRVVALEILICLLDINDAYNLKHITDEGTCSSRQNQNQHLFMARSNSTTKIAESCLNH